MDIAFAISLARSFLLRQPIINPTKFMENFNAKNYRDNLAKDLQEIRKTDSEKAQKILEEEKQTTRYQESKEIHDVERKILQEPYLDKINLKNSNEKIASLDEEKWKIIKEKDEAILEYNFIKIKKELKEKGDVEQLKFWENLEKTGCVRLLESALFQELEIKPISQEEALKDIENIDDGTKNSLSLRKHNKNRIFINLQNMPYETPSEERLKVMILDMKDKGVYGYENLLKKFDELNVEALNGAELLQFVRDYYPQVESGDHRSEHIFLNAIGTVWEPNPDSNNPYPQTLSYHSDAGRCVATWPFRQINDGPFLVKIKKQQKD